MIDKLESIKSIGFTDSEQWRRHPHRRKVHVVSFASGSVHETSGKVILQNITDFNLADTSRLWSMEDMMTRFPEHADIWNFEVANITHRVRPACMAQKSFLVLNLMQNVPADDWIFWIDSSKYHHGMGANLRNFATYLEDVLHLEQYAGTSLCRQTNIDMRQLVSPLVFQALGMDEPRYWFAPHYQNNFFGFKNTPRNRQFVEEWLHHNLNMTVACSSHPHDQAIFSVLVAKYEMKVPFVCHEQAGWRVPVAHALKNVDWLVNTIESDKNIPVLGPFEIIQTLVKAGWFPRPDLAKCEKLEYKTRCSQTED